MQSYDREVYVPPPHTEEEGWEFSVPRWAWALLAVFLTLIGIGGLGSAAVRSATSTPAVPTPPTRICPPGHLPVVLYQRSGNDPAWGCIRGVVP